MWYFLFCVTGKFFLLWKRKPVIKEIAPEILKNGNISFQRTRIERRKEI